VTTPRRTATATGRFDRLRTRVPDLDTARPTLHDIEGKRALFSSSSPETNDAPPVGSVTVDCSRCDDRTVLSLASAVRAAIPAFVLSIGLGHGERESTIGFFRRPFGTFMRCPSCGRGSWTRVTVRL